MIKQKKYRKNALFRKYTASFQNEPSCFIEKQTFLNQNYLGGLWITVTCIICLAILIQSAKQFFKKKKIIKRSKGIFSMGSPFSIEKRKKKKNLFLMVTDYVHIPNRNILPKVKIQLKSNYYILKNIKK